MGIKRKRNDRECVDVEKLVVSPTPAMRSDNQQRHARALREIFVLFANDEGIDPLSLSVAVANWTKISHKSTSFTAMRDPSAAATSSSSARIYGVNWKGSASQGERDERKICK